MATWVGVAMTLVGLGIGGVALRGLHTGWLPAGQHGLRGRVVFRRDSQPLPFWFMFGCYAGVGGWLLVDGVRVLFGWMAPPAW